MIDLTGRLAVVTGGGSGIGRATCVLLTQLGARVAVVDIDAEGAATTAALINEGSRDAAQAFRADISDQRAVDELRDQVIGTIGAPDTIVNVAGIERIEPFLENDRAFWEQLVNVNYLGTVAITRAFLDPMVERKAGRVVNVASDAGRVGSTGEAVYAGTKGGIIAFSKSLAREMARHSITVNCICPGPTDTPMFAAQPEGIRSALLRAIPFRRLATPVDIASAIAFFVSDSASYITGQTLSVSGGLTMHG